MENFRKSVYRIRKKDETPPSLFSIESSVESEGTGVLEIFNGQPLEVIGLNFEVTPEAGVFTSLTFTSPVSVGSLETVHLSRSGTMTLDSFGNGSSTYNFTPSTTSSTCLVTVISRSSGLTDGIGDATDVG